MTESPDWSAYLPRSAVLRDSGLSCRGAGQQGACGPMTPRRLATHGLLFVTDGHGRFTGNPYDRPVEIIAPAVVWLFPGIEHCYDATGSGWREQWLLFEGTAVRAYESLRAWQRAQPVLTASPGLAEAIRPLFAALREGTAVPGRRSELLAATITHMLIGIAATMTEQHLGAPGGPATDSAVDLIVASAFGPATVAQRAQEAGLSPDQLRRHVLQETSLSVHELVIQTRLARAQGLLATTDLPVGSVASQVGYEDPAYFSRLFAARIGIAPSTFRRQRRVR